MIALSELQDAATRLAGHHVVTPLLEVPAISARAGGRVLLKAEPLQRTGSFKFRGAFNRVAMLDAAERARGVVAFSAGNHAQGVAAAAQTFGVKATIIMPADAPAIKIRNTRRLGAGVLTYDRLTEDREAIAERVREETGAVLIPPYDDAAVIAGQGTTGLEIVDQCAALGAVPDLLVCPVGGGGLLAGIAIAARALLPGTSLYSAEPLGFDDLRRSLASGERERNAPGAHSICDAILTATPGTVPFPILNETLAGGLVASDADAIKAISILFEEAKLVVEPGGAIGLAALLRGELDLAGRCAVVVLSGGNMDAAFMARHLATLKADDAA